MLFANDNGHFFIFSIYVTFMWCYLYWNILHYVVGDYIFYQMETFLNVFSFVAGIFNFSN